MSPDRGRSASALIDVDDSILVVIDLQQSFLDKLDEKLGRPILQRAAWLIELAKLLGVPIVVTAEDMPTLGGPVAEIERRLPRGTPILDKMVFGLADDEGVMPVVAALGRTTAVLVGLETDVCIAHSALGLLREGCRVCVVRDATGSPEDGHGHGLARLQGTGVVMTSTKGLFYEWTRTASRAEAIRSALAEAIELPSGLVL